MAHEGLRHEAPFAADAGDFPVGDCPACARLVLAHRTFAADGALEARCVHCDGLLPAVGARPLEALEDAGYGFVDGDEKKGGCATGGSCSLTGKKVAGPGQGGCHGGDCTTHGPKPPTRAS